MKGKLKQSGLSALAVLGLAGMLLAGGIPARAAVPQPVVTHTVGTGDSLYGIAGKFGVSVNALKQVNPLGADWLAPGQVLIIPGPGARPANHTVQKGESLYAIARKFGLATLELMAANGLTATLINPGQVLTLPDSAAPAATGRTLAQILAAKGLPAPAPLQIVVDKSAHRLSVFAGDGWLKSYPVQLGGGGSGPKQTQGDHRTPQGFFYIVQKAVLQPADEFLGSRWLRLGYPNIGDAIRGVSGRLIGAAEYQTIVTAFRDKTVPPQYTALGGGIGIHGGDRPSLGPDWTWGCIGLSDPDVEDLYPHATPGTPVIILP
ncbi:LysM domain-containing protein [Hydrogenispora ethanolica]|uniref:LysM domain-containing protein n=1 Tax=Hydrogenispora ethanolica TaxID=1082276 RepID=A0A4R1RH32_HYDET|nr:L,D-transpeptidase [Hydrogenispora ethanolica]TCL65344.1 LysM domain-containing protein [Hydrogenispora ethanolica]